MEKKELRDLLEDIVLGKDIASIFLLKGRSPRKVWLALKNVLNKKEEKAVKYVCSKYSVDPEYVYHRIQSVIDQIKSFEKENPYFVLDVSFDASQKEIKRKWKELMFRWHPDRNEDKELAHRKVREINTAYDLIKDPEKRRTYNKKNFALLHILQHINADYDENLYQESYKRKLNKLVFLLVILVLIPVAYLAIHLNKNAVSTKAILKKSSSNSSVNNISVDELIASAKRKVSQAKVSKKTTDRIISNNATYALLDKNRLENSTAQRAITKIQKPNVKSEIKEKPYQKEISTNETKKAGNKNSTFYKIESKTKRRGRKIRKTLVKSVKVKIKRRKQSNKKIIAKTNNSEIFKVQKKEKQKLALLSKSLSSLKSKNSLSSESPEKEKAKNPPAPMDTINKFISAYRDESISDLLALFTKDALENDKPIYEYIERYRFFFKNFLVIDYELSQRKVKNTDEGVEVTGNYIMTIAPRSGGNISTLTGKVSWLLINENQKWLIKRINFSME